ncbi:Uncharacterised protein [uncultured Clostridium sp.]|uniref:hypothetical protein n=1 Tax=uncultured Clostridium sp. TaxID=59620 RepID=UPI0008216784|nr:hypothetical protein [uncultured Clostridium sp.]SCK03185.1 Uncharacterised protein [uncultured Clostridium sp.]
MTKRDKIIWFVITVIIISILIINYNSGKKDSIELVGNNDKYYFALYNNNKFAGENKLSDFQLVTYDKENNKKNKYNLSNIDNEVFFDMREVKNSEEWILLKEIQNRKIIGVNVNTGTTEIIVDKTPKNDEIYTIKDLEINSTKLIYSYVSNLKTTVVVKDIVTKEEYEIGTFDTIENIPVTIYKDKAAYILDNKVNIYSLNDKKIIGTSEKSYNSDLLLYEDNIYTYSKGEYYEDLVKLDFHFNEEIILEKVMGEANLYCDNDRVVYNNYFYDTNNNKLYLKVIENSWTSGRLLLDDYIFSKNSKYEKLKEDENYYQYPLKVEFIRSNNKKVNDEEDVVVLAGGEVAVVKANTNYVIRNFEGFNVDNRFILWDLTYENNKVYNIAENYLGELELLAIDINTGDKQLIKKVNERKDHIKHLTINNDELGYLVQDGKRSTLITYNINTKEEKNIDIDISEDIYQILFNDKYIVVLPWDERKLYVLGKRTGNIISKSENTYFTLFDINEDGILVDANEGYELLDYSLNELKLFDSYDKALKYYEKQ